MNSLVGWVAIIVGSFYWLMFLRRRDRYEPEPLHAMLYVLILGGASSTFFAGNGNVIWNAYSDLDFASLLTGDGVLNVTEVVPFFMVSALIEEVCKYTAAYLLLKNCRQLDEPVDGIVYAITVGLGFSVFENFLYLTQHGAGIIFPRLLFAVPLHMATAAIWGMYFSKRLANQQAIHFVGGFSLLILATLLHGFWNSTSVLSGGYFYLLAPVVLIFCLKRIDQFIERMHVHSPFKND